MKVTVDLPLNLGDLGTSQDGLVAECWISDGQIEIVKASALIEGHNINVAGLLTERIRDTIRDEAASLYNEARAAVRAGIRHIDCHA